MHPVEPHPIRIVVEDDLERSRLTVFFRLLLAIPHFVWIFLWSIAMFFVSIVNWFLALVLGRLPNALHRFTAAYVRYTTHLGAYLLLAANEYPGFVGEAGDYPVDLKVAGPERQNRWITAFRFILFLPAFLLASVFFGSPGGGGGSGRDTDAGNGEAYYYTGGGFGLALTVAILAWFACLVRGRMPHGFRDLLAYTIRFGGQTLAYFLILTDRYPNSDPREPVAAPSPPRPVELVSPEEDLRRNRLTVFFRLLLTIPHLVWLILWGIAVFFALIVAWFATLITGRLPHALHRFLSAYLRYETHVFAYLTLVENPFPGFTGAAGSYPVDVRIDPPERQNRWKTAFRIILAIPAHLVTSGLGGALFVIAFLGWFASLALGRMPRSLRALGAYALGYSAQTYGFIYLLTDTYPYSGPPAFRGPEQEVLEPEVAAV
jgi:Domain of unknown function (DUF4389)